MNLHAFGAYLRHQTVNPVTDPPKPEPDYCPDERVVKTGVVDVRRLVLLAIDDRGHEIVQRVDLPQQQVDRSHQYGHGVLVVEQTDEPGESAVSLRQRDDCCRGIVLVRRRGRGHRRRRPVQRGELVGEHAARGRVQTLGGGVHEHQVPNRDDYLSEDGGRGQLREPAVLVMQHADDRHREHHAQPVLQQAPARFHCPAARFHQFVRELPTVHGRVKEPDGHKGENPMIVFYAKVYRS